MSQGESSWSHTDRAAIAAFDDPRAKAAQLHRLHERWWSNGDRSTPVRDVVARSWKRSAVLGVRTQRIIGASTLEERREAARTLREVRDLLLARLGGLPDASGVELVVADADAVVLWIDGPGLVRRATERLGFVQGACWSERAVGSNALGAALAERRSVQFFGAEHREAGHQVWVCTAAPVIGADGRLLGAFTLSGPLASAHPHTLVLVETLAAEASTLVCRAERDALAAVAASVELGGDDVLVTPDGTCAAAHGRARGVVAVGQPVVDVESLDDGGRTWLRGLGFADVRAVPGVGWRLRPTRGATQSLTAHPAGVELSDGRHRHLVRLDGRARQVMAILMASPQGCSARELAAAVYGDPEALVSVRAEVSRLRHKIGPIVESRPYRLTCPVNSA